MPVLLALRRCVAVLLLLMPFSLPAAADNSLNGPPLGSRLEPLLEAARSLSPSASAAALSAEAALDRVGGAGTLPDPTVRVQYGEMNCMPGEVTMKTETCTQFTLEQEFPL